MSQLEAPQPDLGEQLLLNSPEEKRLFRKVWWRIIPFLFLCYVVSVLDRINIGFAQLQMRQALDFSDAMYGLGGAVFYIGYVCSGVPSNMLLARFGVRCLFPWLMILWGLVSMGMMWVSQPSDFYTLRFLLGVFEAGLFPGIVFYLTLWFPMHRRATVMSIFFAGVMVAGVVGGLISGWIMHDMAGVMTLGGWQWMFAIEGAPAVLLGLLSFFYLVDSPQEAPWLNAKEKKYLLNLCQKASKDTGVVGHTLHALKKMLHNPSIYLFAFIYFTLTFGAITLSLWMPLVIQEFGVVNVVDISLYSAIPYAFGVLGLMGISYLSDKHSKRFIYFLTSMGTGALVSFLLTLPIPNLFILLLILSIGTISIFSAFPIFWAISPNYLTRETAAAGIAFISSIGITAGIVCPWLVGQIKTCSGSLDRAFYLMAVLLVLGGLAMYKKE